LTAQLFEHLCGTGESVTRFADGDVEDEFLDAQLPHGVAGLVVLVAGLNALLVMRSVSVGFGITILKELSGCWEEWMGGGESRGCRLKKFAKIELRKCGRQETLGPLFGDGIDDISASARRLQQFDRLPLTNARSFARDICHLELKRNPSKPTRSFRAQNRQHGCPEQAGAHGTLLLLPYFPSRKRKTRVDRAS
jgi:hypothetical protein